MTTATLEPTIVEARIFHVSDFDPDVLMDVAVAGLVGQTAPYRVETDAGVTLPADFDPKATVTKAWVDGDGFVTVELSITYT